MGYAETKFHACPAFLCSLPNVLGFFGIVINFLGTIPDRSGQRDVRSEEPAQKAEQGRDAETDGKVHAADAH